MKSALALISRADHPTKNSSSLGKNIILKKGKKRLYYWSLMTERELFIVSINMFERKNRYE